jgi:ribulose-phosphate 3-epimerase
MTAGPLRALLEPRIRIAPSLLSADFGRLREELAMIAEAGADLVHLDIMDGHFVPNLSFGVPVVEKIRCYSDLYFDTHVMITDPLKYAEPFIKAGSNNYSFHIETVSDARPVVDHIHELGAQAGVVLNPSTPADAVDAVLGKVELVLVMSVWPGFGGQAFMAEVLPKAAAISRKLRPNQRLEFDGGIDATTVVQAAASGADTFVAGSAIFGTVNPPAALREIRRAAESVARGYPA